MKIPLHDLLWIMSLLGLATAAEIEAREREHQGFLQGAETARKIDHLRAAHPAGGKG